MNRLTRSFLYLTMIASSSMFGFYSLLFSGNGVYFTDATAIGILFLSTTYFVLRGKLRIYKDTESKAASAFLLIVVAELIYSYLSYSTVQSVRDTLKESIYYISMVLFYYALRDSLKSENDLYNAITCVIDVGVICSIIAIISYVLLDRFGINILNMDTSGYSFIRYGKPHYMVGSMVVIPAALFQFIRIINAKQKNEIWKFLLLLTHIIIVGKTRTVIFFTIASMLFYYVFFYGKSIKRVYKTIVLFLFAIVFVMVEMQEIMGTITSLLADNSVSFRLNAIEFYLQQIANKPILGMGFLSATSPMTAKMLYGPRGQFYRTDVGIVGFLDCFGLLGLVFFICVIWCAYKIIKNNKKSRLNGYLSIFTLYIVMSAVNLFFMDSFRLIYMPFELILMHIVRTSVSLEVHEG